MSLSDKRFLDLKTLFIPNFGRAASTTILAGYPDDSWGEKGWSPLRRRSQRSPAYDMNVWEYQEDTFLPAIETPADLLTLPAPHLSKLTVTYDHIYCPLARSGFLFPSIQHLSSLTWLDAEGCTFPREWTHIFPPSLRHFRAGRGCHPGMSQRPLATVDNIFSLIEACPQLESVIIYSPSFDKIPMIPTSPSRLSFIANHIIPARRLRKFSVLGVPTSEWSILFDCIDSPLLSEIYIEISVSSNRDVVPVYLREHMAEASDAEITFYREGITCTYRGTHTAGGLPFNHSLQVLNQKQSTDGPVPGSKLEPEWIEVVNQVTSPFTHIERLAVDYYHHMDGQWDTLLRNMSSLVSLKTSWLFGDGLFEALSAPASSPSQSPVACPRLSVLCMMDQSAVENIPSPPSSRRSESGNDNKSDREERRRFVSLWKKQETARHIERWNERRSQLLTCLEHRLTEGHRISELTLSKKWLTGWDLGALRRCVDRIESNKGQVVDSDVFVVKDDPESAWGNGYYGGYDGWNVEPENS